MYSLMCLIFFFCKVNKTDVNIGMNKGVFKLNIEKNTYSVLSTNTHKASKTTYKEKKLVGKETHYS